MTAANKEIWEEFHKLIQRVRTSTKDIKNVIIIMSGKGGVGKSIIASALSLAIAEKGFKVAILDTDFHGPSIPWLMGVVNERMEADDDGRIIPVNANGVDVVSAELALDKKELPLMWRGPLKTRAVLDLLALTKWGELDFLIVDLPPGMGDESQTVVRYLKDKVRGGVMVMIPGRMVSHIIKKSRNFARVTGIKILGAIINMSYFRCPHCGFETSIFGSADTGDIKILANLPLDPQVADLANKGKLSSLFLKAEFANNEWLNKLRKAAEYIIIDVGRGVIY